MCQGLNELKIHYAFDSLFLSVMIVAYQNERAPPESTLKVEFQEVFLMKDYTLNIT